MIQLFFKKYATSLMMLLIITFSFTACARLDVFEKNTSIPGYQWQYNFQPGFDFTITDTASLYNIFIVLRHNDAYRYNNIWLNVGTQFPGDSISKYQRFDLQLGTDAKGWEGTGMDDIWELRKPLTSGPAKYFKKPGLYHFTIAQVMRESPLANVMSVGVRVERVK